MLSGTKILLLAGLFMSSLSSCKEKKECLKYQSEFYTEAPVDSNLMSEALKYRNVLFNRFKEAPIDSSGNSYNLLFYSAHGYGKLIKFEQERNGYFLTIKCFFKEEIKQGAQERIKERMKHGLKGDWFPDWKDYRIQISKKEWDNFAGLITNFNFWTERELTSREEGVLDGYVYFLEGSRPEAKKCDKKTHQFIARASTQHDEMSLLCENVVTFEEELALKYNSTHSTTIPATK